MTIRPIPTLDEDQVLNALRCVIDPEIGLNIVDLGLIYSVQADAAGHVGIAMTLTSMACPLQVSIREAVEAALWRALPELSSVKVDMVWQPPWNPAMISAEGRAQLGVG